jgi:hypothetical protein
MSDYRLSDASLDAIVSISESIYEMVDAHNNLIAMANEYKAMKEQGLRLSANVTKAQNKRTTVLGQIKNSPDFARAYTMLERAKATVEQWADNTQDLADIEHKVQVIDNAALNDPDYKAANKSLRKAEYEYNKHMDNMRNMQNIKELLAAYNKVYK